MFSAGYIRNTNGWFDLETAMSYAGVDLSAGSSLDIEGLSAGGKLIWGDGSLLDGSVRGWVAELPAGYLANLSSVPEPSTYALLVSLLAATAAIFWRGRKTAR